MDSSFEREWSTETPSLFIPFHYFVIISSPERLTTIFLDIKSMTLTKLLTPMKFPFPSLAHWSWVFLPATSFLQLSYSWAAHLCMQAQGLKVQVISPLLDLLRIFSGRSGINFINSFPLDVRREKKKPLYWVWYTKSLKCQYLPLILSNPNPNKPNHLLKKKSYENSL